jgi:hypothetical protein
MSSVLLTRGANRLNKDDGRPRRCRWLELIRPLLSEGCKPRLDRRGYLCVPTEKGGEEGQGLSSAGSDQPQDIGYLHPLGNTLYSKVGEHFQGQKYVWVVGSASHYTFILFGLAMPHHTPEI